MPDLTQVAEALAAHILAVNTRAAEPVDSCVCGWRPTQRTMLTASVPPSGWEEFAAHQAQMLADSGLVATETQWGVRLGDDRMSAGTYTTRERAERGIATWVREGRNDLEPALLMRRQVTAWMPADEGGE